MSGPRAGTESVMTPQSPQSPQQHNHLARPIHKEPPAHAPNAALMIDFDNVTMAIRSDLQTELKRLLQSEIIRGKVAVQRAYADWRRYPQYIVPLSESSIDLIFAPAHGANKKNATDIRLAIDALELVFTRRMSVAFRSEEHTSELQSRPHLVCRLLLEKKKKKSSDSHLPVVSYMIL